MMNIAAPTRTIAALEIAPSDELVKSGRRADFAEMVAAMASTALPIDGATSPAVVTDQGVPKTLFSVRGVEHENPPQSPLPTRIFETSPVATLAVKSETEVVSSVPTVDPATASSAIARLPELPPADKADAERRSQPAAEDDAQSCPVEADTNQVNMIAPVTAAPTVQAPLVAISDEVSGPIPAKSVKAKAKATPLQYEMPQVSSGGSRPAQSVPATIEPQIRVLAPKNERLAERADVQLAPITEVRTSGAPGPTLDRTPLPAVERASAFTPQLVQITRDLLTVADQRDIRFNVRPDVLGPVAVAIEQTDAGPKLRLGVETEAAVQAVRHAEPALGDPRSGMPFAQVTVDLGAPEQRGRRSRVPSPARRSAETLPEIKAEPAMRATGRYA